MKPSVWCNIWLRPRTKISRREQNVLKNDIRHRLKTEDYTPRLPRFKPRIRYRLLSTWYWAGDERRWVWK